MLINFNQLKTFYNALAQKMKGFRGNWNQNDPTADDYIKNRTHWEETIQGKFALVPEMTVNISDDGGYQDLSNSVKLTAGEKYTVILNGITYECVARDFNDEDAVIIGNGAVYGDGIKGNDEPFSCDNYSDGTIYLNVAAAGTYTISICSDETRTIVHKLDKKFIDIPDGLVTEEGVMNLMDENLAPVAWTNDYDSLSGKPTIYTDVVRYSSQSLTDTQKNTVRSNIGVASSETVAAKMNKTNPIGTGSFSLNRKANTTIGYKSVAEGDDTTASGQASHAEGYNTTASGVYSHAEGGGTTASGTRSHAEGKDTVASGQSSHTEGEDTIASGTFGSHAEGRGAVASGQESHAEGYYTMASGKGSHAEGGAGNAYVTLTGEANATTYSYENAIPKIGDRIKVGDSIIFITVVDKDNRTCTVSSTLSSSAVTNKNFAFYYKGLASGDYSHSEGNYTTASNNSSHAEGHNTTASGAASHAEGKDTVASGDYSHAEGNETTASGIDSHAEGCDTTASGVWSHAEGSNTIASGAASHAEGGYTTASSSFSHAEGDRTIAASNFQHAQGKYNIEDSSGKYAHIVGNGDSDTQRSNAHTLDWDGNAWFQGGIKVGGISQDDTNAKEIATTEYVNNAVAQKSQVQIITWEADD